MNHQYFIAHQVNNLTEIKTLVDKNIGLEVDVAYSNTKDNWVIAHHDYNDSKHPSLECWFKELIKALKDTKCPKLYLIWLDIKTADTDLLHLVDIISRYIPSNISLIYDLGQPINILDNKYHKILEPFLRENDGIATWITKDQLTEVSLLASILHESGISNSVISYGEVEDISSQILQELVKLNDSLDNKFKKVFTWNVELNNEIECFSQQEDLDGQIIGYKKSPWDKACISKLTYFEKFIDTDTTSDFWKL